jgi:hypothetical protein
MRARYDQTADWRRRGQVLKGGDVPAGYTANTVITEWLTLNCEGPWACHGRPRWIGVAFDREADATRARAHYEGLGLWRDAPSQP